MAGFVDPRHNPQPRLPSIPTTLADSLDQLEGFHHLCREGRVYEVEEWIKAGRPLQVTPGDRTQGRRIPSALEIAIETGQQALVLLLLSNGVSARHGTHPSLNLALRARRVDLVDLLWAWGADPTTVSPPILFETYNTGLFERFYGAGLGFTAHHALADTLATHMPIEPLFGFAKRYREAGARFQTEFNIALGYHAHEGNRKGVHLCPRAGASPLSIVNNRGGDPTHKSERVNKNETLLDRI